MVLWKGPIYIYEVYCQHRGTVDPYQPLALINCRYTAYRVPQAKPEQSYKLPVRVMVYNKIHSADDPWYDERADTAHPLLLDLPGALWKGGHDADKHVAGKVVAALAAYRKPGVPSRALNRCFTLQRCCKSAQSSTPDPSAHTCWCKQTCSAMICLDLCRQCQPLCPSPYRTMCMCPCL